MKLTDVKQLIKKYDIYVKKRYGQNFLIDENILMKIANTIRDESLSVIEIGPGLGSLTEKLLSKFQNVLCYEIDKDMVNVINDNFKDERLIVLEQDILKSDLKKDIDLYLNNNNVALIANLPYYITTPILTKVLEEAPMITKMVVMMQKEVAERICGTPSTKDYNSLSVLVQYFTDAKILFTVPPHAFFPAPDVDSSVVYLEKKKVIDQEALSLEYFLKFNRVIFQQRRKTLANNLLSGFRYSKSMIEEMLKKNGLSTNVRAEKLSVNEIVCLSNAFFLQQKQSTN